MISDEELEQRVRQFEVEVRRVPVRDRLRQLEKDVGRKLQDATIGNALLYADENDRSRQEVAFRRLRAFAERVELEIIRGTHVAHYGLPGTGKKRWLVATAKVALSRYDFSIGYQDIAKVLIDVQKAGFGHRAAIFTRLCAPTILILSDILPHGRELTINEREFLKAIVDERDRTGSPIWFSVNVTTEDEFRGLAGDLLGRRLWNGSFTQFFEWAEFGSPAARLLEERVD